LRRNAAPVDLGREKFAPIAIGIGIDEILQGALGIDLRAGRVPTR